MTITQETTMGKVAAIPFGSSTSLSSRWLLRREVAAGGPHWLPAILIFGSIAAVAYSDFMVSSVSLGYLYILPLGISAMFLRARISYALIAVCVFFHDLFGPPYPSSLARIAHNLTAVVGFTFVVYVIQRYVRQREQLDRTVREQRDLLLLDVELAAQVQRMFLPTHRPSIPGLEIAGMMQPARGVSGDYYDYIPINEHTIQIVIADVAGKGVPAALLMSATAAAVQLEAREERDLLEVVNRLNSSIHSVSGGNRYVTLLLAEIDARQHSVRYVNCGHNPALMFQAKTHDVVPMSSSCFPIGMFDRVGCAINPANLTTGDILVLYTDGVTEAENSLGEEFGMDRLSELIRHSHTLSADALMNHILESVTGFSRDVGFTDDATILVLKFDFDSDVVETPAVPGPQLRRSALAARQVPLP
jgi:serine phosphatase RsbU (regulator of sigma subunit)